MIRLNRVNELANDTMLKDRSGIKLFWHSASQGPYVNKGRLSNRDHKRIYNKLRKKERKERGGVGG